MEMFKHSGVYTRSWSVLEWKMNFQTPRQPTGNGLLGLTNNPVCFNPSTYLESFGAVNLHSHDEYKERLD